MTMLRRLTLAAAAALLLAAPAAPHAAGTLNGTWNLVATGTPHGDLHFQATFTQDAGAALTANVTLFDNTIPMSGEVRDGAFRVTGDSHGSELTLSGKLKADGTLEGFLSSERGDLLFKGTRAK